MKNYTEQEIKAKAQELWPDVDEEEIKVGASSNLATIRVARMCEYPKLTFAQLMALSEFFETKNINDDDRYSSSGCETCDYGSCYEFTLTVRPEKT